MCNSILNALAQSPERAERERVSENLEISIRELKWTERCHRQYFRTLGPGPCILHPESAMGLPCA